MNKRRWSGGSGMRTSGDPDPRRFSIAQSEPIGNLWLSTLHYTGCINFEGRKVLLTTWDPRGRSVIDPHFAEGSGILARFEPSADGMAAARMLAAALSAASS